MASKMLIDAAHPEETRVVAVRGNRVEEFDYLAVYDPQSDAIYVIPSTMMEADGRLRIEPSRNGQEKLVKWASNFTWERHLALLKPSTDA